MVVEIRETIKYAPMSDSFNLARLQLASGIFCRVHERCYRDSEIITICRVQRKSDKPATGYDSGYNEEASRKSSPNRQAHSLGSPKSSPRSAQELV